MGRWCPKAPAGTSTGERLSSLEGAGTRRDFLATAMSGLVVAATPLRRPRAGGLPGDVGARQIGGAPAADWETAADEYCSDRTVVHLNAGGVSPTLRSVHRSQLEYQEMASAFPYYALRERFDPEIEGVRRMLAGALGCRPSELALVRNASEAMEICQLGLDLAKGDEVIITNLEFPRMANTWAQRARRDGIAIRMVDVDVPFSDPGLALDRIGAAITPRTRLISVPHMVDVNGQIMPVRAIADLAHERGVPVLVDGAQTFGQVAFDLPSLDCDYFATSLHKWLGGPHGTGALFIKQDRIPGVWPLMPCHADRRDDIRKFEDVGTDQWVRILALADAIDRHETWGAEAKERRIREMRERWLAPLRESGRVRIHTDLAPGASCSLTTVSLEAVEPVELRDYLWNTHRIRVRPVDRPWARGIRVSAGLHNRPTDLDRFVDVMLRVAERGIPA